MEPLAKLSAVPGVLGSVAYDAQGQVLAQAVPAGLDAARVQAAVATLLGHGAGLEAAVGTVRSIDLRYTGQRLVVRAGEGGGLLVLCSPTVNLQTLMLSAADTARSLAGASPATRPAPPAAPAHASVPAPAPPAGGQLWRLVQRIDQHIIQSGLDRFKTRGRIAFKAGFSLDLVEPDGVDEPARLQKLRAAASDVLGKSF